MKAFLAGSAKRWGLPQQHGGGNEKTPSFLEKKSKRPLILRHFPD